jgi:DsbC/DsbD-like thiol-disulfide interchange protein
MHRRRAIVPTFFVLVVAGLSVFTEAQNRPPATKSKDDPKETKQGIVTAAKHLTARASVTPRPATPGSRVTLALDVTPGKDIHVYAPEQAGYIPIELTVDGSQDFKSVAPRYPAPRPFFFEPLKETVKVYDRPFRITVLVTLADTPSFRQRASNKDTLNITGTLDYQACDDAVCYRPEQISLLWPVALTPINR